MRSTLVAVALGIATLALQAHADTTQEFFDLCGDNQDVCYLRIELVRADAVKAGEKICLPKTMSLEGYVNEVTYWIGEQGLDMKQDAPKSILAALKALYTCKPSQGAKP